MSKQLIQKFYDSQIIKFGEFTLASGLISPVYLDFRSIISYPILLREIAEIIWEKIKYLKFDLICGIAYTALPIATCIALDHQIPMLICRKEIKNYGTKKQVEGIFQPGQICLIIEDVITSGINVQRNIKMLQHEELITNDVVALVDREQGARNNLLNNNCQLHSIFTLTDILTYASHMD